MALKRNRVELIGRLGGDPELRYTNTGQSVANFTVATDEGFKNKETGEWVDKVEWHNCVAWGKTAEFIANRIGKGQIVLVEGKLQTRKWQDKEGVNRYTTEILVDSCMPDSYAKTDGDTATTEDKSAKKTSKQKPVKDDGFIPREGKFPTDATGMDSMTDAPF